MKFSKFLALLMLITLAFCIPPPVNADVGGDQQPVYAQVTTPSPTVTPAETQALEPEVKAITPTSDSAVINEGPWIDPSKLPDKDPNGIFGVGWEWLMAIIWGMISVVIYFYPTASKYKWVTWLFDLVAFFFPNRKKGGGSHNITFWGFLKGDF